jgi:hypothetical protein
MNPNVSGRLTFGRMGVRLLCLAIAIFVQFSVFLVLRGRPAFPQVSTGTLSGTVRDQTGAVVPAAPVVLTNTATNTVMRTSSNEAGLYLFPGLIPGAYSVAVEVAGMKKFGATVTIVVQRSSVVDVTLEVGAATMSVSVNDVSSLLTVDRSTLSEEMDRDRIQQLPLNGRTLTGLLTVVPGANGLRSYGQRDMAQDMVVDGVSTTNNYWGVLMTRQPGLDTVQEVTVVNNNASAEFTRPMTMVVATKSGTNQLHGSIFEVNRNSGYGVARQRQSTYTKPPYLNRNEFGVSAGGPVWLPKIYNGKNRTFWFFGYEGSRTINPSFAGASVPTQAMRNGDFSGLVDAQGRLLTIYNPWSTGANWSRQPFAYGGKTNVIDPSLESPLAKYLMSVTPLPTTNDNPLVASNWFGNWPSWTRSWTITARFDHQFSDRDRFYAVYQDRPYTTFSHQWSFPTPGNPDIGAYPNPAPTKSIALNYLHIFSPSLNNNLSFTIGREIWYKGCGCEKDYGDQLGLPNPMHQPCWFGVTTTELPGHLYGSDGSYGQWMLHGILQDNAVKIVGKHELKFGVHARYDQLNTYAGLQNLSPYVNPSTQATSLYDPSSSATSPLALPYTGSALANEYLGVMNYENILEQLWYYDRSHDYALYLQDNFRVTPRLTLNMGLRWEYFTPLREKYNDFNGFDAQNHAVILGAPLAQQEAMGNTNPAIVSHLEALGVKFETPQQAGWPDGLMTASKDQLGPRLGFAYKGGDGARSFVLRGGYSISYFPMNTRTWNQGVAQNAPTSAVFLSSITDATVSPDGISNYGMRSVPTVIAGSNSANAISLASPVGITAGSAATQVIYPGQPNMKNGRVEQWNATLEKEVAKETIVRVTYQGSHSENILQAHALNTATPSNVWYYSTGLPMPTGALANVATRPYDNTTYGTLNPYYPTGYMNEDGMQFQFERRYRNGYAYQIFYTVTNAFGDVGAQGTGIWVGGDNTIAATSQYLPGAVPSDDMARDRLLNYQRDTSIPKHEIRWNWMIDVPVGKGKKLLGNSPRVINGIIGGWRLSGIGSLSSRYATLPTTWYPNGNKIEVYGEKYKIQDCTSGVCYPAYLYFNGYIPSSLINSHNAAGQPNGYEGVPANYQSAWSPLIPWGQTALPANAPAGTNVSSYWDTNTTWVTLKNGTVQRTTAPFLNPLINQYILAPWNWNQDLSLVKTFQMRDRFGLRVQVDAFNALNHPGIPNSVASTGLLSIRNSANSARVMQLQMHLSW